MARPGYSPLVDRCGKGVVGDDQRPDPAGYRGYLCDVEDVDGRVGGCLEEDDSGSLTYDVLQPTHLAVQQERRLDADPRQVFT